jgi:hypothetical protein
MRRGTLTVPPEPGTRPKPTSGSENQASGWAHHPTCEGRQLDAGPDAGAVDERDGPIGHAMHGRRRAATEPHQMGGRRIERGAEVVEVAAGAEGRAGAAEPHRAHGVVGGGDRERGDQLVPHGVFSAFRRSGRFSTTSSTSP